MYQKMYVHLFNAVSDALLQMERQNFGAAADLLIQAQQACEDIYLDAEDETTK